MPAEWFTSALVEAEILRRHAVNCDMNTATADAMRRRNLRMKKPMPTASNPWWLKRPKKFGVNRGSALLVSARFAGGFKDLLEILIDELL